MLSPHVRHELRHAVPHGWTLHRRADPNAFVPLKFRLTQSNLENLDAYLLDIADPTSHNYGKHWTAEQVAATFRPSQDSVDTVHSWLVNGGGVDLQQIAIGSDGSISVNVTVSEAENLLAAEYYVYQNADSGRERIGCHNGYRLPEHVSKHVDVVWPTVHFNNHQRIRRAGSSSGSGSGGGWHRPGGAPKALADDDAMSTGPTNCDKGVTLDCLRALYNFDYQLVAPNKNTVAVVEIGSNVLLQSDLDLFFKQFDPQQVGHKPTLVSIAGGHLNASETNAENLGEATMDFQLVMGLLGRTQDVLLYQVGKDNSDPDPIDELLAALDGSYCSDPAIKQLGLADCGNKPRANVVSISYSTGVDFFDPTDITSSQLLQRQCAEIGKLSLQGMTFVASSGDTGVSFGSSEACIAKNGSEVTGNAPGTFLPQFPASCPYVTAVGATEVSAGNSVSDPETATTAFPSGGGFSNLFAQPSFQARRVNRYLKTSLPASYDASTFNASGRAYPDVSANGFPTVVAVDGNFTTSGGTSASAPIFASFVAAINDARIAAGKGPVGWINPALYSHLFATAFNDVKSGSNPGCGTEGFPAARGWDPVTGLGTPNFKSLLARFMSLP
ncbi:subtilisin-like protein [Lentinus tigrinus ALCF2SS1-7]|uniref:tripeptidyl-peptidase II n=1 Tax=Lentinus tigrinus ALCF2SS1-6 TaxID=1328759 RepID=A0A5C2SA47_9APHY|nr:subtilisin-like protein [Lentinus tigrinus ALCF2SS1-6]RPD74840.1 subtilisin-like protein [Lentinus tigrinus ALCF2SS1-7]